LSQRSKKSENPLSCLPNSFGIKVLLVFLVINGLEDVLEGTVVALQDGVLGAHVQRIASLQSKMKAAMGEVLNGLISIVHAQSHTRSLIIK